MPCDALEQTLFRIRFTDGETISHYQSENSDCIISELLFIFSTKEETVGAFSGWELSFSSLLLTVYTFARPTLLVVWTFAKANRARDNPPSNLLVLNVNSTVGVYSLANLFSLILGVKTSRSALWSANGRRKSTRMEVKFNLQIVSVWVEVLIKKFQLNIPTQQLYLIKLL